MIKINTKTIEVKTGVLASNEQELTCSFRQPNNTDFINMSMGSSPIDIMYDCFMKFNYPVELEDEKGEVIECASLRDLALYSVSPEILKIITPCAEQMTKAINGINEEAQKVEKKSSSVGKSSKPARQKSKKAK